MKERAGLSHVCGSLFLRLPHPDLRVKMSKRGGPWESGTYFSARGDWFSILSSCLARSRKDTPLHQASYTQQTFQPKDLACSGGYTCHSHICQKLHLSVRPNPLSGPPCPPLLSPSASSLRRSVDSPWNQVVSVLPQANLPQAKLLKVCWGTGHRNPLGDLPL